MTEEIKEMIEKEINNNNFELNKLQIAEMYDYITNLQKENEDLRESNNNWQRKLSNYKSRNEKAVENAKEKIKKYESYIHDLENGNYPSPTIRQERQELIFRIREQEDLINILQGGDE